MKTQNTIANTLSGIDTKYIHEYTSYRQRRQGGKRAIISVLAASLCIAIAIPISIKLSEKNPAASDRIWPWSESITLNTSIENITIHGLTVIHDAHVNFNGTVNDGQAILPNGVIDFPATLYCHLYQNTGSLLAIRGQKFSSSSYTCDITENGEPKILKFTVTAIKISEVLKENNSSGYKSGDIIYIYEKYVYEPMAEGDDNAYKISCNSMENDFSVNEEAVYLLTVMHNREEKQSDWKVADTVSKQDTWRINCVRTSREYEDALASFKEHPEMFEGLIK